MSWVNTGWMLIFLIAVSSRLFLKYPEMDIAVSAWFYTADGGFYMADIPTFIFIRELLLWAMKILALLAVLMLVRSIVIGARRAVPLAVWGFINATFWVGPIILVNGILKAYWGRARPEHVDVFGGDALFSPPLLIADQCTSNCSFVSGEGSALATMIFVGAITILPSVKGYWRPLTVFGLFPLALFGIALRVLTGRHFTSDTIFAALFCGVIVWVFYAVFNMRNHRNGLTWRALIRDLRRE